MTRNGINISDWLLSNEEECERKGQIMHRLGYARHEKPDRFRRGTLGHKFIEAVLSPRYPAITRASLDVDSIMEGTPLCDIVYKEHEHDGWAFLDETMADAHHAAYAAGLALDNVSAIKHLHVDDEGPMVERTFNVPIGQVLEFHRIDGEPAQILAAHCKGAKMKADAITAVHEDNETILECADWKFSKWDVQPRYDAQPEVAAILPHPQGSFFWSILKMSGLDIRYMARVRIHAERPEPLIEAADIPRNLDGLPSLVHKPTAAADFEQAIRESEPAMRVRINRSTGEVFQVPYKITAKRHDDLARHVEELKAKDAARVDVERLKVYIDGQRIIPRLAMQMNRDRLLMFADHIKRNAAHRSLKVYNGSPCTKRFGCQVQEACHLSMSVPLAHAIATCVASSDYVNMYKEKESK